MITIKLGRCQIKTDSVEDKWKQYMKFIDDWVASIKTEYEL